MLGRGRGGGGLTFFCFFVVSEINACVLSRYRQGYKVLLFLSGSILISVAFSGVDVLCNGFYATEHKPRGVVSSENSGERVPGCPLLILLCEMDARRL